jgi:hypothetical protein
VNRKVNFGDFLKMQKTLEQIALLTLQKEYKDLSVKEIKELIEFFDLMCGDVEKPEQFTHMDLIPELWNDWLLK